MVHASWRPWALVAALTWAGTAQAGLFDDEEARKAILDLRARIQAVDDAGRKTATEGAAANTQMLEQLTAMRRSLLELNNQLEAMRGELAKLRGDGEQMARDLATLQRTQKDANQNFDERLRKMEPQKVALDGREFTADPAEKRAYDDAMAIIREGNFDAAAAALAAFQAKLPEQRLRPDGALLAGQCAVRQTGLQGRHRRLPRPGDRCARPRPRARGAAGRGQQPGRDEGPARRAPHHRRAAEGLPPIGSRRRRQGTPGRAEVSPCRRA